MAPIRRYLRITKHSVLEVRIYLDRPADAESWLLRRDNPALPRVIQAVRPLVLPKLREENERANGRGSKAKKKGVKDVVVEDDFEVSIFLTDLSSRHSVLTKQKMFKDKPRIQSNSGKLTGWLTTGTSEKPVVLDEDRTEPIMVRDEDEDEVINLNDIPEAGEKGSRVKDSRSNKRRRRSADEDEVRDSSDETDVSFQLESIIPNKRSRRPKRGNTDADIDEEVGEAGDDKKKPGLNTSYDGFSIYGRILCLVIKRKGPRTVAPPAAGSLSSQQMLESWVSTQAAAAFEQGEDGDNDG